MKDHLTHTESTRWSPAPGPVLLCLRAFHCLFVILFVGPIRLVLKRSNQPRRTRQRNLAVPQGSFAARFGQRVGSAVAHPTSDTFPVESLEEPSSCLTASSVCPKLNQTRSAARNSRSLPRWLVLSDALLASRRGGGSLIAIAKLLYETMFTGITPPFPGCPYSYHLLTLNHSLHEQKNSPH